MKHYAATPAITKQIREDVQTRQTDERERD